jgi:hypothetical protein
MKKTTLIVMAFKSLRFVGASLRMSMGGVGAALAAYLLWENLKKKARR